MQSSRKKWYEKEQEENSRILQKFWEMRVQDPKYKAHSVATIKDMFLVTIPPKGKDEKEWAEELNAAWKDPATFEDYEKFSQFFSHVTSLKRVAVAEELFPQDPIAVSKISKEQRSDIEQYIDDKKLSVAVLIGSVEADKLTEIDSAGNNSSDTFSIHSVGKVFTGILAMRMLSAGIFSENDYALNPIQLDKSVYDALGGAPTVLGRLKEITLHQALTHHAGLGVGEDVPSGDYMANYGDDIKSGATDKKDKLADLLPYVFNQVSPKDEHHYSNTGMLIGGLSLEYLYEKYRLAHPDEDLKQLDFNGLMQKYVIEPANLANFQSNPPDNFKYNLGEPNAKSFTSSPAGGSFTTASDLEKFAKWLYEECRKQPDSPDKLALIDLIKKYGQEFFHDEKIAHAGDAPSGSAYFSLNLQTGNVLIVLNDQKHGMASSLGYAIEENIFSKERAVEEEKKLSSTAMMAKQLEINPASLVPGAASLEGKQTLPLAASNNDTSVEEAKKSTLPTHLTPKSTAGK